MSIIEKDILPKDAIDKNRWLADVNDDYFQEMGKRGAKKKNCENNYTFSESNDPILLTLNHKNAKLATINTSMFYSSFLVLKIFEREDLGIWHNKLKKNSMKP